MTEVSATEAARNFSDLLDAVEHRGEHFAIVRRGKIVARLDPAPAGNGQEVKGLLRSYPLDADLAGDVASVRGLIEIERRP